MDQALPSYRGVPEIAHEPASRFALDLKSPDRELPSEGPSPLAGISSRYAESPWGVDEEFRNPGRLCLAGRPSRGPTPDLRG